MYVFLFVDKIIDLYPCEVYSLWIKYKTDF